MKYENKKVNNVTRGYGTSTQRYGNLGTGTFIPRKPVRSFRDLEIYQRTIECSVLIIKNLVPKLEKFGSEKKNKQIKYLFTESLINCSMSIPLNIGEAHSIRFASLKEGESLLERAMAGCNKMVIYLEQIKGLYGSKVDGDLIDDLINRYLDSRTKTFHLEKSWRRFQASDPSKKKEFKY